MQHPLQVKWMCELPNDHYQLSAVDVITLFCLFALISFIISAPGDRRQLVSSFSVAMPALPVSTAN